MLIEITDHPDAHRYEAWSDGTRVGLLDYRLDGDRIALTHAETFPRYRGNGIAGQVVRRALDDARARSLLVLPFCPFVRDLIADEPEYLDLVDPADRPRFQLAS